MSSMTAITDKPLQLSPFKVLLIYTHFIILSFSGETVEEAKEKAFKVFKEQYPDGVIGAARFANDYDPTFVTRPLYESSAEWQDDTGGVKALMVEVRKQ